jgi:hypothetical protein
MNLTLVSERILNLTETFKRQIMFATLRREK